VSKASEDLPEPGDAGDHHQAVAGDLDVDVLEVVLAGAADDDLVRWRGCTRRRRSSGGAAAD
jgi:hypothetical protein